MTSKADTHVLSWEESDPERRVGFPAGKFTQASLLSTLLLGVTLGTAMYGAVLLLGAPQLQGTCFALVPPMFYQRGSIPYFETFFTGWSLAILFVKWCKLRVQRRALRLRIVPTDTEFVLSPDTASIVLEKIEEQVDDHHRFILFSRIVTVLSSLRNMGRVSDVNDLLAKQADVAEDMVESSYSLLKGFIWAIPILGFIGTVIGLSMAIGSFGEVLTASTQLSDLKGGLQKVTTGLAVAFDTTYIGLVQALVLQLMMTAEKKAEEDLLDDCREYCHRNLVARCRILPLEQE